ncbi:hypothetical protein BDW22DRAFT_1351465 [Trametopsis cervina]|nr:hypothetical protein BDW22DRAFT_1351465 [Trametopsis cervina]
MNSHCLPSPSSFSHPPLLPPSATPFNDVFLPLSLYLLVFTYRPRGLATCREPYLSTAAATLSAFCFFAAAAATSPSPTLPTHTHLNTSPTHPPQLTDWDISRLDRLYRNIAPQNVILAFPKFPLAFVRLLIKRPLR